ncbi:hypothetical protein BBJ28_00003136 [Nothophytophthora sp. Chile5]|nr:hypothetical protein BBJ28_00003136 [Nothophytophthora sp. Chile5]
MNAQGEGDCALVGATATAVTSKRIHMRAVVRVRPLLPRESLQPVAVQILPDDTRSLTLTLASPDAGSVTFSFDACYDQSASQHALFQREVSPAVSALFAGVNTTVLAYGAAGSGKTFTMEGSKRNPGLVPRSLRRLFEIADEPRYQCEVTVSYFEVYNDRVHDLFGIVGSTASSLPTRQQLDGSTAAQGLTRKRVASLHEFETLYETARGGRNPSSSRSHSVLEVHVRSDDTASGKIRHGKLLLIDWAGSEPDEVIAASDSSAPRVPLRDAGSKLAQLVQDSSGRSHTVMLCNVAPTVEMYHKTLQSLNYAVKARVLASAKHSQLGQREKQMKPMISVAGKRPPAPESLSKTSLKRASPSGSSATSSLKAEERCATQKQVSVLPAVQKTPAMDGNGGGNSEQLTMQEKLLRWKQAKQNGTLNRRSDVEEERRRSSGSRPSIGGVKRKLTAPASGTARRESIKPRMPNSSSSSLTAPNKPRSRSSVASSHPASMPSARPGVSSSNCSSNLAPRKGPRQSGLNGEGAPTPSSTLRVCSGSPTQDKENHENQAEAVVEVDSTPLKSVLATEEPPVLVAKKLIRVAIGFEKKRRFVSAISFFKRAHHLLPEENAKLAARLAQLERSWPVAKALIPSQQMSTVSYTQLVLERDLMTVLNDGSKDELMELHAIGDKRADRLVEERPFHQVQSHFLIAKRGR